mmetsp:Transcript_19254/g.47609  ORF Transcript_19254/g.47609 Transcript_19254/m.47609 type:complete len:953 (+) Transcript_19254:196-3054(+)|eukprot:CAMPEP_0113619962 /NCGR_PEP_ID=MMETSP0017_2-20120614/10154_1 /TAXON_ID=2856 /ORGANISM="Cylindrotheca closterium" /LENGTH=952 /DNA_ID=CAMNT_0000529581 /DNA_START=190 /DNA_END=3048 /DNA_ORIENTATION=+ /assembly_acc=CAM_ASM_000147
MEAAEPQSVVVEQVEQQQEQEGNPVTSEAAVNTTTSEPQAVAEEEEEETATTVTETPELVETTTEDEELSEDIAAAAAADIETSPEDLSPEVVDEATHSKTNNDKRPLRVLFLSDETGGGHRASAEALGKQFMIQYPGSTVEICNLWTEAGDRVLKSIVKSYKDMSASPWQWKLFYHATNTKVVEVIGKNHSNIFCAEKVKARISEFQPDAVISVHPTMNHLARIQTRLIGKDLGKHIPFYTVVTDLGSAHLTWFQKEVNKIYVATENLVHLASQRQIPATNIVLTGLPIRHGFAIQAKALQGDRTLPASKEYIAQVRQTLGLIESDTEDTETEQKEDGTSADAKEEEATATATTEEEERESPANSTTPKKSAPMILVMGGGEGVGSLSDIVNQLYATLTLEGQDATLCVVCGRNAALKEELENRDWFTVVEAALQERIRKRRMNRTLKERIYSTPPPNFCSPDTILMCDENMALTSSSSKNNVMDGPKSMEQVMAEAALLPSPLASSPNSQSPINEKAMINSTKSPLMQLMTKLPGITQKKQDMVTPLTDTLPFDNSIVKKDNDDNDGEEDDDEEEESVGLNPPIVTTVATRAAPPPIQPGRVQVVGLGFVTNMEEYMVAADILVTKAGPGTIAEAASVGLPVVLTSFLPGQEAGNVDVVLEAGFGDYCDDPLEISARVCTWLKDDAILDKMSRAAHKAGHPHAADDIVADIGSETVTWMKMNERWKGDPIYQPFIELGHTLVLDSYLHDKTAVETLARTSSAHQLASAENTRRSLATAGVMGVGAAVGAVVAGPLLPIGLAVGSAVIPALPVGLVVGGTVSGFAANQMHKQGSTATSPQSEQGGGEEEGKEGEQKEERDDEVPKSRYFGWASNPASPANDPNDPKSPVPGAVDETTAGSSKSKWFGGWGNSKKAAEVVAVVDESLVTAAPETPTNATAEVTSLVSEPVQG